MSIKTFILDWFGSKVGAKVSPIGELIVAPYGYSKGVFKNLSSILTAFNFFGPRTGKQFVITGIRGKASRSVSNTVDATVQIYETQLGADSTTSSLILHEEALIRGEPFTLIPLNLLVSEGVWVNASTTDATIPMTIWGYYIPTLEPAVQI